MKKFHVIALTLLLGMAFILIQSFGLIRGWTASGNARSKQKEQASQITTRARVSEQITLHAAGRGGPWINLQDGYDLMTAYTGASGPEQVMERNQAQPLALAAGDFDEDGVPDLISGYACANCSTNLSLSDAGSDAGWGRGGLLTLHRGNVDAIYPNTAEAEQRKVTGQFTDAPFLSPAQVFEVPVADFIGAGDFDADGHLDVVMAARGSDRLYWMAGDGRGGFGRAQEIELAGAVTALVTGEINRADGLVDVIVGINESAHAGSAGVPPALSLTTAQVLVFESPEGALKHEPEAIALPTAANGFALGQLDDSYEMDLAVAAGSELLIVHGRDRCLSLDQERRSEVIPAKVEQRLMAFSIASLAIGDFSGDYRTEVALLSADGVVHVLERGAKSKEWGKIIGEVATGSRSETVSATEAGNMAPQQGSPAGDPAMPALPLLVRARVSVSGKDDLVVVDRGNHQLHIVSQGVQSTDFSRAFSDPKKNPTEVGTLNTVTSLDVEGEPVAVLPMRLNADAFSDLVILKDGGQSPLAVAPTAAAATFVVNSSADGADIAPGNGICETTVGGGRCSLRAAIQEANVKAGADTINFSVSSSVLTGGEIAGTITDTVTIDGTSQGRVDLSGWYLNFSNASGNSVVRGVLVRKGTSGIFSSGSIGFSNSGGNIVEGCWIGLDPTGAQLNNGGGEINLYYTNNNTIGGTAAPARNVIGSGITSSTSSGNRVQGNYLGTDANGATQLSSEGGVTLTGTDNTVGGGSSGARNVMTARVYVGSTSLVQGNYIGVDANGDNAFTGSGNGGNVFVGGRNVSVVGNVIVSRFARAIEIHGSSGASDTIVQGNFIGTDRTGTKRLVTGNITGILISQSARNLIGGSNAGARNIIIAGDVQFNVTGYSDGIDISGPNSTGNQILGNFIGADASGLVALGGGGNGVEFTRVNTGPTNNRIGGTAAGEGNVIVGFKVHGIRISGNGNQVQGNFIGIATTGQSLRNTRDGIRIDGDNNLVGGTDGGGNTIAFNGEWGVEVGGVGNAIRRNSIFSNNSIISGSGISVSTSPSPPIPNLLVNAAGSAEGTLNGTAGTTYQIEFFSNTACNPSGFGEGRTFLSQVSVTVNAGGSAPIPNVPQVARLTATATRPDNTTSQFSRCITPTNIPPTISLNPTQLVFTSAVGTSPPDKTVTLTNNGGGTLNWQAVVSTNPPGGSWLSVTPPASGSLAANQPTTLTISVNALNLLADVYEGTITVSSPDAPNSPQKVKVTHTANCPGPSGANSETALALTVASCTDILNLDNVTPASGTLVSESALKTNGLQARINYLLQSKKQADLVLRVFDQDGNRVGSSVIKSINRPDPAPNPIPGEVFVIPGSSISLFPNSTTLTMTALFINPLNSEVIKISTPPVTYPIVKDSIKILNPKVNGQDPLKVSPFSGAVDFECDIEYTLVNEPVQGDILLRATGVSADGPGTILDQVFVLAETGKRTKHLRLKFAIPSAAKWRSIPVIEFAAILRGDLQAGGHELAKASLEFSPPNWVLIDRVRVNGQEVFTLPFPPDQTVTVPYPDNRFLDIEVRVRYIAKAQALLIIGVGGNAGETATASQTVPPTGESEQTVTLNLSPLQVPATPSEVFKVDTNLVGSDGAGGTLPLAYLQTATFRTLVVPKDERRFQGTLNNTPPPALLAPPTLDDFKLQNMLGRVTGDLAVSSAVPPALTDLIAPGGSTPNSFVTDTVDGASTTVLKLPHNNGLALSPTTSIVSNDTYSVVMLLKFDEANKRRRILDFKNGTSDNGLYAEADNNLRFSPVATGSGGPITANKYVQIAITRDATGVVTGYLNGARQFQFTDTNNDAVIDSNNTLRFFQDNTSGDGTGEASAGSVARLRLYGRALFASEIAGLDREPGSAQFSVASYSVSEAGGSATITVTRTGAISLPATVDYITSDQTAKQPLDYTTAAGTLSFAAGETTKTFQVQVTDNLSVDLDRQLLLFLQNPNGVTLGAQSAALLTIADNDTAPTWEGVVLATGQTEIKTWTTGGRTYAYLKLSFPNDGYRVIDWGQAVRSVNDFAADAAVQKFTGASVQAVTTTAQIYDLGTLSPGSYHFAFKNTGTVVKTLPFTVAAPPFPANPIDVAREFVKQQYRDFLNREADQAGEDFWTDNITKCSDPARLPAGQTEAECTTRQRETTSGAFFLSPEFQYTGYYVYRMYQGGLGRQPKLSEFLPDAQFVGNGIIVNGQLSAAKINQNKADFAAQFVNCTDPARYRCSEFKAIYDGLSNQQYVDKLFLTTGVNASASDRTALVNGLNGATETRASVLQKVVDGVTVLGEGNQQFTTTYGQAFYDQQFTRAFVQLEYFGYMKRDPDEAGYNFWLEKLNQFGGDFVKAEMVLAFISSPEYRARFGQP